MESQVAGPVTSSTSPPPDSRRARREAEAAVRGRESRRPQTVPRRRDGRSASSRPPEGLQELLERSWKRWIPRAAVLSSLAIGTIALPIAAGGQPDTSLLVVADAEVEAPLTGPSAFSVLTAESPVAPVPAFVAQAPTVQARSSLVASRSQLRVPLPGCDPSVIPTGTNGRLRESQLCELWQKGEFLRPDAAVSITALNQSFQATFQRDLCITDSYRSLGEQVQVKAAKPGLAATAGRSEHGWGLAVDLCQSELKASGVWKWLKENGPLYGWENPSWARSGGGGAYEPWHWEYFPGVEGRES